MWTIEYDGTEQSFGETGITDPMLARAAQSSGVFSVNVPGAATLTESFGIPYFGAVKIRRGRSLAGGVLTGGDVVFVGRRVKERKVANSTGPGRGLSFEDAHHDLSITVFQHVWKTALGTAWPFSRLNLFQAYPSGYLLDSGAQITEILNYAIASCGVNLQVGTIDPAMPLPIYPVKAITCSEAIQLCLRPQPDAVTWIDPTTAVPTYHCRVRSNLTAVTLPYSDNGVSHESSDITARDDLQVPSVMIQYIGGPDFENEIYPPGATGLEIGALVCPIDLKPRSVSTVKSTVTAVALDPTSLDWWKQKKPELKTATSLALVAGSVTIKNDAGATVSLATYPNEYIKGEIASWMPVVTVQVTVSAKFTYTELDASGRTVHKVGSANAHTISTRIKVTDSAAGDVDYSTLASVDPGEAKPVNLSQSVYEAMEQLHYEGSHLETLGAGVSETMPIRGPWNVLNLSGGAAEWATMRATLQRVVIDFWRGRTEFTMGPPKQIGPAELLELLALWRFRAVWENPALRTSGSSAPADVETGGDTATENTTAGNPVPSFFCVSAPSTR